MPQGGPNEGFASNYGYGGMPGTTTGMAQGGYAGTGNPQVGAQGKYQSGALAATGQLPKGTYSGGSPWARRQAILQAQRRRQAAVTPPAVDPITGIPIPQPKPNLPSTFMGAPPPVGTGLVNPGQWPNYHVTNWPNINTPGQESFNGPNYNVPTSYGQGIKMQNQAPGPNYSHGPMHPGSDHNPFRQFGGPVAPGGTYQVGENGPETLQMGPGGGGQVIPNNPADRLGGMNPQLMQQMFQLMQQQRPQPNLGQAPQPAPAMPAKGFGLGGPQQEPQMQPPRQVGDWRQQMRLGGSLSQPTDPGNRGFGLSSMGQSGLMGQMRQRLGA